MKINTSPACVPRHWSPLPLSKDIANLPGKYIRINAYRRDRFR
jgi:hypothetical protein